MRELLYIHLDFQVSEMLYNYLLDYLINYTIGFIIITS